MIGVGTVFNNPKNGLDIHVTETKGPTVTDICTINVGTAGQLVLSIRIVWYFNSQALTIPMYVVSYK